MAWTKPMISEISVGLEINSYACAEKQFHTNFNLIKPGLSQSGFFFVFLMIKKSQLIELFLVYGHRSWWKRKKYRKESSEILRKYRHNGWKLRKRIDIKKNKLSVDSRFFRKYFLFRRA